MQAPAKGRMPAHLIQCPTLLINGDGEVGNTPRDVARLAARIPNGRLEIVAESGHTVHEEQPEKEQGYRDERIVSSARRNPQIRAILFYF
jgi:pimeloyl-ACP methyl ester carboxylesterase